jgi:hypothetical protein
MIVQFVDKKTGTTLYINPDYVVSVRPDPDDIDGSSIIKLEGGESVQVLGEHTEVAAKLGENP